MPLWTKKIAVMGLNLFSVSNLNPSDPEVSDGPIAQNSALNFFTEAKSKVATRGVVIVGVHVNGKGDV